MEKSSTAVRDGNRKAEEEKHHALSNRIVNQHEEYRIVPDLHHGTPNCRSFGPFALRPLGNMMGVISVICMCKHKLKLK